MDNVINASGNLVYVVGEVKFYYASEVVRDSFFAQYLEYMRGKASTPIDSASMAEYLQGERSGAGKEPEANLPLAGSLLWGLSSGDVPLYVLEPPCHFGEAVVRKFVQAIKPKANNKQYTVSLGGRKTGQMRSIYGYNKQFEVVVPDYRSINLFEKAIVDRIGDDKGLMDNFLEYSINPLSRIRGGGGSSGSDRAINYAVSRFLDASVRSPSIRKLIAAHFMVDTITSESKGADRWQVKISLNGPTSSAAMAGKGTVWMATVNVSDVVPLICGEPTFTSVELTDV